jgi:uncharacterized protein (DUF1778 family)
VNVEKLRGLAEQILKELSNTSVADRYQGKDPLDEFDECWKAQYDGGCPTALNWTASAESSLDPALACPAAKRRPDSFSHNVLMVAARRIENKEVLQRAADKSRMSLAEFTRLAAARKAFELMEAEPGVAAITDQSIEKAARSLGMTKKQFIDEAAQERAQKVLADDRLRPHLWHLIGSVRARRDFSMRDRRWQMGDDLVAKHERDSEEFARYLRNKKERAVRNGQGR